MDRCKFWDMCYNNTMKNLKFFSIINSVLLKKMFAIFLVAAIFFNGFVPKSSEFKSNFLAAINCAVATQTDFFEKYSDTVVMVTTVVAENILKTLNIEELMEGKIDGQNQKGEKGNKPEPVNTSADNCIITEKNTNNQNEINILKAKAANAMSFNVEDLNIMYSNLKISSEYLTKNIGILFFILFSILVVRIKDTIANIIINKKIERKEPTWL